MKRELIATAGGREIEISVEPGDDGRWRITIDGATREVDARQIRPGTWSLVIDGRAYLVDLDRRKQGTALSSRLAETVATIEDARRKRLAKAAHREGLASTGEELRAPIAGKVVKLLVEVGATVSAGQGVIVLEAMKMENELVAERGGTVASIHKQAGQPVDTGDLLVTLT
ncbi:MAG TPA: biotin/lipoyl-containing protein [Kofleriaceae bacterium]|nr:biotin/lipoyl-containing protein [Kofleriaceae bacterium]